MVLTKRHFDILLVLAKYYTLSRAMIQDLVLPDSDPQGRVMRKLLNKIHHEGLINKTRQLVTNPDNGAAAPVYFLAAKGAETLAVEFGDDRYYCATTATPSWTSLAHWLKCSEFHIALDRALALQDEVTCPEYINEWDTVNKDETDPAKKFRLFTEIRKQPRLVFAPDAGFLLSYAPASSDKVYRKAYYLELDRHTTGIRKIASSKTPGAAAFGDLHLKHFPGANTGYAILNVMFSEKRRDAMRRAISKKPGSERWRFVAWPDLKPNTLWIHEPIVYRCDRDEPIPLIKKL